MRRILIGLIVLAFVFSGCTTGKAGEVQTESDAPECPGLDNPDYVFFGGKNLFIPMSEETLAITQQLAEKVVETGKKLSELDMDEMPEEIQDLINEELIPATISSCEFDEKIAREAAQEECNAKKPDCQPTPMCSFSESDGSTNLKCPDEENTGAIMCHLYRNDYDEPLIPPRLIPDNYKGIVPSQRSGGQYSYIVIQCLAGPYEGHWDCKCTGGSSAVDNEDASDAEAVGAEETEPPMPGDTMEVPPEEPEEPTSEVTPDTAI